MAYDEELAQRFRDALGETENITEKRMMGGVCFLLNGNMVGGADKSKTGQRRFMFRVGKDNDAAACILPGAQPMVQGGREMRGFFLVDERDCAPKQMYWWIKLALDNAAALPPK